MDFARLRLAACSGCASACVGLRSLAARCVCRGLLPRTRSSKAVRRSRAAPQVGSSTVDAVGVIELLIVVGVVAVLALGGLAVSLLSGQVLLLAGAGCIAFGIVLGVPTGAWYHVVLHRTLRRRGPLPPRWWVHPSGLHERLEPAERAVVLAWFKVGGAGFGLVMLGCAAVVGGLLLGPA